MAKPAKSEAPAVTLIAGQVVEIPLDMLMPDPTQPRRDFDAAALAELALDIEARGVENPIRVRGDYTIKHGERRWRASKMAGKTTIPCLLAGAADDEHPAVEWLLDQAADNEHQKKLTAMDWAHTFRRLVDDHGTAVKDIPDLLARRGITMSRPYVSNLMRLTELPDWAQELITRGQLPPAEGKYLLMARPYPPAMAWVKKELAAEINMGTLGKDVDYLVRRAYRETAIALSNNYGEKSPLFNWSVSCKGCDKRQQVSGDHYCLDEKCFDQKQAAVKEKAGAKGAKSEPTARAKPNKPAGPTKVKPDDQGVIHVNRLSADKYCFLDAYKVRFEPAMHCGGCEHNKPASQYKDDTPRAACFNIPCFEQKQRAGNREEGVAQWLDKRVLPEVLAKLAGNYDLQFQIIAWMALGAPTQNDEERKVRDALVSEQDRIRVQINLTTPAGVIQAYGNSTFDGEPIAAAGVRAMLADRGNFYAFARHLGVRLTPEIASIDREYLDLKHKREIIDIARKALGSDEEEMADFIKRGVEAMRDRCLDADILVIFGVPPDVRALFEQLQPSVDPDHNEDYDQKQGD